MAVIKNRNVPGGQEFWDHVEGVAQSVPDSLKPLAEVTFKEWQSRYIPLHPNTYSPRTAEDCWQACQAALQQQINQLSADLEKQNRRACMAEDELATLRARLAELEA